MPCPQDYQIGDKIFYDFLNEVRIDTDLGSTHMSYTVTQGVFQCFKKRISIANSILFCNLLPAPLRALFVADWNPFQEILPAGNREDWLMDTQSLRKEHNFTYLCEDPVKSVAKVIRNYIDSDKFEIYLKNLPSDIREFWSF